MLLGRLDPLAFFAALGVGLAFVYAFAPRPRKVVKYPTPVNAGKIVYKGEGDDDCFVYSPEKVECTDAAITASDASSRNHGSSK
jgi:hypothetical protein